MLGNTCAIFSHIQSLGFWSGLRMCSIPTMPSLAVYKGYRIGHDGRHGWYSLHIQSLRVWSGLLLCTISTMPSLVVYKRILYRSGWASQVLFITYTIIEGQVGLGLCSILTMPSLVVYKGYRASRVLFFTYTIIEGFIEHEHMRNRISLVGHHWLRTKDIVLAMLTSLALFITYKIFGGIVGRVRGLVHALTGCVQRI